MTPRTNKDNAQEGGMTFESGQVQVTRYGTVKDLKLSEDDLVFAPIPGQPVTRMVRESTDFLGEAIADKIVVAGDELVFFKVGQHKKLQVEVRLGHVGTRKRKTPTNDEPPPGDEGEDGDDI